MRQISRYLGISVSRYLGGDFQKLLSRAFSADPYMKLAIDKSEYFPSRDNHEVEATVERFPNAPMMGQFGIPNLDHAACPKDAVR